MESEGEFWMDMAAPAGIFRALSAASDLQNQDSGDFSFHDGSHPSCSSSSERNSSTDLVDGAAEAVAILDHGEVRAMLQDAEVRAMLRKVTINEGVLNKAIQILGGGEKGLQSLMEYIMVWVKQQRDIESSSQQLLPSNPVWNFSTAQTLDLQPSSHGFPILGGNPPTTQLLDREVRSTRRLKSRKLMTGEPEMGAGLGEVETGFCPSSFISTPEDCKPEVTTPDRMAPCSPRRQQPVTPFTSARIAEMCAGLGGVETGFCPSSFVSTPEAWKPELMNPCISRQHIAMPFAEPTPAMAMKAARRHRMSRQRQSFHARAASPVGTAPVSEGDRSLRKTNAAPSPAVTGSGMSGPRAPVNTAGEIRNDLQP